MLKVGGQIMGEKTGQFMIGVSLNSILKHFNSFIKHLFVFIILYHSNRSVGWGEEIKQLNPASSNHENIQIVAANGSRATFASYNTTKAVIQRLYTHICMQGATVSMDIYTNLAAKFLGTYNSRASNASNGTNNFPISSSVDINQIQNLCNRPKRP